jgi:hypothetical protein
MPLQENRTVAGPGRNSISIRPVAVGADALLELMP